jgi:hypothetical protein
MGARRDRRRQGRDQLSRRIRRDRDHAGRAALTPPSADTVNVGPAAQTDVGIVKATSEKANVTASPIIVLGISEASLERGNGIGTTRLSQSYTYFQLLQQRSRHYAANSGAENTRLHDERKTESNRRACNRPRHRGVVGRVRVGASVRT